MCVCVCVCVGGILLYTVMEGMGKGRRDHLMGRAPIRALKVSSGCSASVWRFQTSVISVDQFVGDTVHHRQFSQIFWLEDWAT